MFLSGFFTRPTISVEAIYDKLIYPGQTEVEMALSIKPTDFNVAKPGGVSRHFVVIIDVSESMGCEGRLDAAKRAAREVIWRLDRRQPFSVVAFSTTAWLVYRCQPGSSSRRASTRNKTEATAAIQGLRELGATNFEQAILLGYNEFVGSRAQEGHAVLLSDGEHNRGDLPEGLAFLTNARRDGKVFSVACRRIGHGTRVEFLRQICDTTLGGPVGVIEELYDLPDDFGRWLASIDNTTISNVVLAIAPEIRLRTAEVVQVSPWVVPVLGLFSHPDRLDRSIYLGSMGNNRREFYVKLQFFEPATEVAARLLATARVDYTYQGRRYSAPMLGRRPVPLTMDGQFDTGKTAASLPTRVEAARDRIAYFKAVDAALAAWAKKDDDAAALDHFRRAVELALKWNDSEALRILRLIVNISPDGYVSLKPRGEVGDRSMSVDAGASQTCFGDDGGDTDRQSGDRPPSRTEPE